ncbi:YdcF family protein [Saccharopolyspora sp. HNM0983]|uniref:YdcF family protein n=1 Tax=Saccharopolyspora montiporae TaxID=2781240 RepID=A0A929BCT5_9PSEU|nr:YdcF family protein [Saccharopolyspora sp. HNM0983]MBE9376000.1 YdcF family protein [Saccharopolyspora sp. HNM0983]
MFVIIAGFFALCFLVSFALERRLLRNGVFLALTIGFGVLALLVEVRAESALLGGLLLVLLIVPIPLLCAGLAVFLVVNGITMLRREGKRLSNLLSLLAGMGMFGYVAFVYVAIAAGSVGMVVLALSLGLVLGYISFLFTCFVGYALVYDRIPARRNVDFIVVLGSGLLGSTVPPLLASRLDLARRLRESGGRGADILVSGGRGPGEDVAESRAMADYLIDVGVPEQHIVLEDASTSTRENLRYSKEIMQRTKPGSRCLIVTNSFHAFRAAMLARAERVDGHVIGSHTAGYYWPSAVIREFLAVFRDNVVVNTLLCTGLAALPPAVLVVLG